MPARRQRYCSLIAGFAIFGAIMPASAELLASYDGEDASIDARTGDLTDDGHTYWGFREGSGRPLEIDHEVKRSGLASVRFAADPSTAPKDRVEVVTEIDHGKYPALNNKLWRKDAALAFSVFFPVDFPSPSNWFLFHQIKQHDQKYMPSPNVSLQIRDDRFVVVIRFGGHGFLPGTNTVDPDTTVREIYSAPMAEFEGRWTDFACRFKVTDEVDGYVEIFQKPDDEATYQRIVDYRGPLGYTGDSATHDIQIHGGIYRGGQPLAHVLWQDDVKIGTTLSDVIPSGTTAVP